MNNFSPDYVLELFPDIGSVYYRSGDTAKIGFDRARLLGCAMERIEHYCCIKTRLRNPSIVRSLFTYLMESVIAIVDGIHFNEPVRLTSKSASVGPYVAILSCLHHDNDNGDKKLGFLLPEQREFFIEKKVGNPTSSSIVDSCDYNIKTFNPMNVLVDYQASQSCEEFLNHLILEIGDEKANLNLDQGKVALLSNRIII